jgi:hypothetical protein
VGVCRWNDVSRGFRFGGVIMSVVIVATVSVGLNARTAASLSLDVLDSTIATAYQLVGKTTTSTDGEPKNSSQVTEVNSKKKNLDSQRSRTTSKPTTVAIPTTPPLTVEPLAMLTPIDTTNLGNYSQLLNMSPYMDRVQAVSDIKQYKQQVVIVPLQASTSGWKLFNVGWAWWLLYLGVVGVAVRSSFVVLRQRMARQIMKRGSFEEGFL